MRRAVPNVVAICCALGACAALVGCTHRTVPRAPAAHADAPPSGQRNQLTPDIVLSKIRGGYTFGMQRCYTRYLKNRSGHGRVLVSFTVDERGRALDGTASGVPPQLGDCIVAEVARWRFPAPKVAQSFALPIDLITD